MFKIVEFSHYLITEHYKRLNRNDLIFVEKEKPISYDEVEQKLSVLKNAVNSKNNDLAREALRCVIPTFKSPEEVNKNAEESMEMNIVKTI